VPTFAVRHSKQLLGMVIVKGPRLLGVGSMGAPRVAERRSQKPGHLAREYHRCHKQPAGGLPCQRSGLRSWHFLQKS
jgi:hypothetical protein